jgi:hypothetical protein
VDMMKGQGIDHLILDKMTSCHPLLFLHSCEETANHILIMKWRASFEN